MAGRKVLVTGGSGGIGLGIALYFAKKGAQVGIVGRGEERIAAAQDKAQGMGLTLQGYACDVRDANKLNATVERFAAHNGGLDVLCCNAGVFPSVPLNQMTEQQWDDVHAINSKGTFFSVQAAYPWLKQSACGRIVLTSSITGPLTGYPGWAHYASSKAAQLGFMRSAALEFAADQITVNAVLPGNVLTEGLSEMGEEYIADIERTIPLKRLGSVDDIAAAVCFLASEDAGYITGQTIVVDGGLVLPETLA
ncbi:3-oxoacyl-ACP reductase FabG [Serratia marcescens]|uniref:3-oxoacyl-ACP reductase FabG n=1 Tax=Serratia sp. YC16 TaxID=2675312 RepID=UPI0002E8F021|nr:3-oxoacyl-ACP reductase FabG [Serratia sp. YC16]WMW62731.1 3-oxoacyl-ACP reductase FabG [Serratia marcescens]